MITGLRMKAAVDTPHHSDDLKSAHACTSSINQAPYQVIYRNHTHKSAPRHNHYHRPVIHTCASVSPFIAYGICLLWLPRSAPKQVVMRRGCMQAYDEGTSVS